MSSEYSEVFKSMTNLLEHINILREKSETGKLIVFVGAGVSRNVEGLPSWNELVDAMANAVGYKKCDACKKKEDNCEESCKLKNTYSTDEYLKIPQYLYNENRRKYNNILSKKIKNVKIDAPLSSAIFDLNPAHIITTNYDNLLESSSNELRSQYKVVVEDKDLLVSDSNKYIIKMHGDINHKDSIVLKEQDYLEFSQRRVLIELFVKALLTNHTILFLGYSLNDYNIKLIISWLNFIRQQNNALDGKIIGYICLDEDAISDIQKKYIENNNIRILNLRHTPLLENIPTSLTANVGKRLYSFLRIVHDSSLESSFDIKEFMTSIVQKTKNVNFIPYNSLLKILKINKLSRIDNTLSLLTKKDFNRLHEIFEINDINSKRIKQFMFDNGIYFMKYRDHYSLKELQYTISNKERSALFLDDLYKYYLSNNYKMILSMLKEERNIFKKAFYQHFIYYYSRQIFDYYDEISFRELSDNEKLIYIYNKAVLDNIKFWRFDLSKLINFLNNFSTKEKQEIYSMFQEVTNGFKDKKIYLKESLNKLKELYSGNVISMGSSLVELYDIKSVAQEVYKYYFYNTLFCQHLKDIKEVLSIYIEAILCTNGANSDKKTNLFGIENGIERYSIDFADWDIMTKFISTKSLASLISKYHVNKLSLQISKEFIFHSFENLIDSIQYADETVYSSFWSTLINSAMLILHLELTNEEKGVIEKCLEKMLSNDKFVRFFFSVSYPDYYQCLHHLVALCDIVMSKNHYEIFEKIISSENFYDYINNSNQNSVRDLMDILLMNSEEAELQDKLFSVYIAQKNASRKIKLIWLIQKNLVDEKNKKQISDFLYAHFGEINDRYLIDFILSDLIDFNEEKITDFLNDIIKLDEKKHKRKIFKIPDHFDNKLDVLYILIIFNKITDISALKNMRNKQSCIDFILSPDDFDYSQVDFSDYKWQNFTKKQEFLEKFIKEKEKIKPKIIERLKADTATEFEKKMLYGYFLDKSELLD